MDGDGEGFIVRKIQRRRFFKAKYGGAMIRLYDFGGGGWNQIDFD